MEHMYRAPEVTLGEGVCLQVRTKLMSLIRRIAVDVYH